MKKSLLILVGAVASVSLTFAAEKGEWWQYKTIEGSYRIYSGALGEEQPPTTNDRKISFVVTGSVAKGMFDSMSPDIKQGCSQDKKYHERQKGNVSCVHDSEGYTCHFGFDLRTRASISGGYC
ncbi:MAG: hypothetical protein V4754_17825 [Pseudomonadota bacterium]